MNHALRIAALLAIVLLPGRAACAAPDETVETDVGRRIDAWLSSVEPFGFSGAVLVEQDGVVIVRKGYGLADRGRDLAIETDTRFDLGSLAKQFTAALVLRLVDEGALDLDDPLPALLRDVPADKSAITVRHLLSHSSGLPYHATIDHSVKGMPLAEVVPLYLAQPLAFEPGARFAYSNPGYTLLAAIAERVTGEPFPQLLRARLTGPAGLRATGHVVLADDLGGPWARAYMDDADLGAPNEWTADPEGYGAGGVVSTIDDLHAWLAALRDGHVIARESVEAMWTPQIAINASVGYGFGWFVATTPRGTNVVFHAGDYQGFNTEARLYRDEARIIVLLSNARLHGSGVRGVVMHAIATMAAGDEVEPAPTVVAFDAARVADRMGAYATEDGARFTLTAVADGVRVESEDAAVIAWMSTGVGADADLDADTDAGAGTDGDTDTRADAWAARARAMLEAGARGDFEPVRAARHRAVVVRGGPTDLETVLGGLSSEDGALEWAILGSRRAGPVGSGRTYARVRAGDDSVLVRFAWMDGALLSIEETDTPSLDLRAVGEDSFAWYDLFTGRAVTLRFEGEGVRLEGAVQLRATRA